MTQLQTAIRKGRKFDQVLEGARKVFLRDGFEGASVDDIAREAGVSKATLYSYFPDKRLLFMAIATGECKRQADEALEFINAGDLPVREVLRYAAGRLIDYITSPLGLQTYRLCVAETDRFPALGQQFYASGPLLVRSRMVEYLQKAVARGELAIEDFDLAAEHRTMILVTHDMRLAADVSDHVVFLHQGRIEEEGPPETLFGAPKSERLKQFLSATLPA